MKILVLSGPQGSGKSTICADVTDKYLRKPGTRVIQMKFADVIYWIHNAALDILSEYLPQEYLKSRESLVKDGPLLQLLGTEWGRKTIGENIWVEILRKRLDDEMRNGHAVAPLVIIDDCRFENEFDAIPEALRVRLCAEEGIRKKRCSMWRENTSHPSETGLDSYAAAGKFDLYLNTDRWDVSMCSYLIMAQFDKNIWVEKRRP